MKKIIYTTVVILIQHLTINVQHSTAQAPFTTPDNIGSGNCLEFNAANERVDLGNPALWNNTFAAVNGTFSIEAWINVDNTGDQNIVHKSTGTVCGQNQRQFNFYVIGRRLQFNSYYALNGSRRRRVTGNTVIPTNEWVHVAVTYDGAIDSNNGLDRVNLYVNGQQESTALAVNVGVLGDIVPGTAPLSVGLLLGAGDVVCSNATEHFDGQMDEVRIWNDVRTPAEIQDNMSQKLNGNEAGLIGYWNMNEGAGSTIGDLTTNGNNGTLN